jgi:hypothetical protein
MTEISARRTAGHLEGCDRPMPRPLGLRAARGDDLKDEIAVTIQSLLDQKPFLLLFTTYLGAVSASTFEGLLKASTNEWVMECK